MSSTARWRQWVPAALYGPPRRWFTPEAAAISSRSHIALTLDDGPDHRSTPTILSTLERHDVRATYFLVAEHVPAHATLVAEMHAAGHEIAIHGWTHTNVMKIRPEELMRQISNAAEVIAEVTGERPTRYRPPYGITSLASREVARQLDLTPTLWSAWGRDWSRWVDAEGIVWRVNRTLRPGGTVLLHDTDRYGATDSWRRTNAALDRLIREWKGEGVDIGPLREH